jgi:uncharacterized protein YjbJ (UPF0337 family)
MGTFEEAKGKVKEKVGDVTNNPDLAREGEAQKDKGKAEREETKARVKAKEKETEQKAAEKVKK